MSTSVTSNFSIYEPMFQLTTIIFRHLGLKTGPWDRGSWYSSQYYGFTYKPTIRGNSYLEIKYTETSGEILMIVDHVSYTSNFWGSYAPYHLLTCVGGHDQFTHPDTPKAFFETIDFRLLFQSLWQVKEGSSVISLRMSLEEKKKR